jgi:hypothetical protein
MMYRSRYKMTPHSFSLAMGRFQVGVLLRER